jgi:hypothetical protein
MAASAQPSENRLLGALPPAEAQRWGPLLEAVELPLRHVLTSRAQRSPTCTFQRRPSSLSCTSWKVEPRAEIAVVGNEGIVGVSLFMGGESTPSRAVVQSAGQGFRLKANLMKEEFNRAGPVLHLLLRYTQALITQMAQTAVCNRHHTLDQ